MTEREVPMAPGQLEMWHAERTTKSVPDNLYGAIRLHGRLDIKAMERALAAVVARHEPLRTRMVFDPEPAQLISDAIPCSMSLIEAADEEEVVKLTRPDAGTQIHMDAPQLWRIKLMRLPDGDHVLGFVFHHVIMDGWSLSVFFADLSQAYGQAMAGQDPSLAPLQYTYSDYCREQRHLTGAEEFKDLLAHWRKLLPPALPELRLPRDGERTSGTEAHGEALDAFLDASATEQMERRARAARCTLFTLMLDASGVTLSELGSTDDVIIGVPFHNRTKRHLRPLIGCLANDVPMALTGISHRGTDRDRLDYAKSVTAAALRYPTVPWQLLRREVYGLTDVAQYTFCLNVQSPPDIAYDLVGIEMTDIPMLNEGTMFDFDLTLSRVSDHIEGDLVYASDLYSRSRAEVLWSGIKSRLLKPAS
jgi:hypothetical protein